MRQELIEKYLCKKKIKTTVMMGEGEMEGVTQPVNWGACPPGLRR